MTHWAGFESLNDQKRPVRVLTSFLEKRIIPHALLFTGHEGIGRQAAAVAFAKACNCDQYDPQSDASSSTIRPTGFTIPCDRCRSCRLIRSDRHPDIITVKPSGQFLRVDQIRLLRETLALKPYAAKVRFAIILKAEAMNPEASNALLKILEEPPAHTILILCAVQSADLLPTIVSRCQPIPFSPLPRHHIRKRLIELTGMDAQQASVIAGMAEGSQQKALQMAKSDWRLYRRWVLEHSGLKYPHQIGARPVRLRLAFAEQLSRDKKRAAAALEMMAAWLMDLIIQPLASQKVINVDLIQEIQYTAQNIQRTAVLDQLAVIQSAQKDMQSNANFRLVMERMMIQLAAI